MTTKTTMIRLGKDRTTAYAERVKTWNPDAMDYSAERIAVRVFDSVAQHYVEDGRITEGQRRMVISRTLP